MSRIAERFQQLRAGKEKALILYLTAGDPQLSRTEELIVALDKAGADILEIGVPFSDPTADGPVIQEAAQRALRSGTNLTAILEMIARIRTTVTAPCPVHLLQPVLCLRRRAVHPGCRRSGRGRDPGGRSPSGRSGGTAGIHRSPGSGLHHPGGPDDGRPALGKDRPERLRLYLFHLRDGRHGNEDPRGGLRDP